MKVIESSRLHTPQAFKSPCLKGVVALLFICTPSPEVAVPYLHTYSIRMDRNDSVAVVANADQSYSVILMLWLILFVSVWLINFFLLSSTLVKRSRDNCGQCNLMFSLLYKNKKMLPLKDVLNEDMARMVFFFFFFGLQIGLDVCVCV